MTKERDRRLYSKEWRDSHREHRAKENKEWKSKHPNYARDYTRKWREKNPDKQRLLGKKQIERNKRIKQDVLIHYGNGALACVVCGETRIDCLSLDHITGGGNEQRRQWEKAGHKTRLSGMSLYRLLFNQGLPNGIYQTLCMNCQFIKRMENKEHFSFRLKKERMVNDFVPKTEPHTQTEMEVGFY